MGGGGEVERERGGRGGRTGGGAVVRLVENCADVWTRPFLIDVNGNLPCPKYFR
jgi:hypothetical protein